MAANDDDDIDIQTIAEAQLAKLEPLPPNADLRGMRPDQMNRAQLARALTDAVMGQLPPKNELQALMLACAIKLREVVYKDGVLAERCVLCLQRTYGELGRTDG